MKISDSTLRKIVKGWVEENYGSSIKLPESVAHRSTLVKKVAENLHQFLRSKGYDVRAFRVVFIDFHSLSASFLFDDKRRIVVSCSDPDHIKIKVGRAAVAKTPRTLPNGVTYNAREHAYVDVDELSEFPVAELSRLSGLSPSAIRTARRCGGHVRVKSKKLLESAMERLRKSGKYRYNLRGALRDDKITRREFDCAVAAIKNHKWIDGELIAFSNFSAALCKEIAIYNDAAASCSKAISMAEKFALDH